MELMSRRNEGIREKAYFVLPVSLFVDVRFVIQVTYSIAACGHPIIRQLFSFLS